MTDNPFKSREISAILFSDLSLHPTSKKPIGTANVNIVMTNENGEPGGPGVQVEVGVDIRDETNLRDFRLSLLERTLFLLKRLADETPESLQKILLQTYDQAYESSSTSMEPTTAISRKKEIQIDVIEFLIAKSPGRTERELAEAIHGSASYQQQVNQDCQRLASGGKVERRGHGGPADPYRYYPIQKSN